MARATAKMSPKQIMNQSAPQSSGYSILIKNFRLATPAALREMLAFSKELLSILPKAEKLGTG